MESIPDKQAPMSNYKHTTNSGTKKAKARKCRYKGKQIRVLKLNNITKEKAPWGRVGSTSGWRGEDP